MCFHEAHHQFLPSITQRAMNDMIHTFCSPWNTDMQYLYLEHLRRALLRFTYRAYGLLSLDWMLCGVYPPESSPGVQQILRSFWAIVMSSSISSSSPEPRLRIYPFARNPANSSMSFLVLKQLWCSKKCQMLTINSPTVELLNRSEGQKVTKTLVITQKKVKPLPLTERWLSRHILPQYSGSDRRTRTRLDFVPSSGRS